jgi:hypothetical protein
MFLVKLSDFDTNVFMGQECSGTPFLASRWSLLMT